MKNPTSLDMLYAAWAAALEAVARADGHYEKVPSPFHYDAAVVAYRRADEAKIAYTTAREAAREAARQADEPPTKETP